MEELKPVGNMRSMPGIKNNRSVVYTGAALTAVFPPRVWEVEE